MSGGIITAAMRHLIAAGVTGEALLAAVADMEDAKVPARSSAARRQAEYRERLKAAEDITSDVTDVTYITPHNGEKVSPKKQQSIPPSHTPPIGPPFPVSKALEVWNEMAERTGLPRALSATGKRQTGIKARLAEHGEEGWRKAVAAVERSAFCRGENQRGWRADIGFMIRPENFQKLIEGAYDPKGSAKPVRHMPDDERASLAVMNAAREAGDPDFERIRAEHFRRFPCNAPRRASGAGPPAVVGDVVARALRGFQDAGVGKD